MAGSVTPRSGGGAGGGEAAIVNAGPRRGSSMPSNGEAIPDLIFSPSVLSKRDSRGEIV